MLQHNIIIQITVIFIWARSNCKSNMAISFCILIYTAPQYTSLYIPVSNKLDMTIKLHITYLLTFE